MFRKERLDVSLMQDDSEPVSTGIRAVRRLRETHAEVVKFQPKGFESGVPDVEQARIRETGSTFVRRK
jgi:hypothetical protein